MRGLALLGTGTLVGALVSHFLDPDRGRARRVQARDHVLAALRRTERKAQRAAGRRARYTAGRLRGLRHRVVPHRKPSAEFDDATLADKIRSEVLGKAAFAGCSVSVDCVHGVVHLRGEIPSTERIDALVHAVGAVTGVQRVESYLHLPGEPAPNKEAVLNLAGGGR